MAEEQANAAAPPPSGPEYSTRVFGARTSQLPKLATRLPQDGQCLDVSMKYAPAHMDAAVAAGKWPLLLDSAEAHPFITFLQYQPFRTFEAKKGMVEACVKKERSAEEVADEWRTVLVQSMLKNPDLKEAAYMRGIPLWVHLSNAAVDFRGKFSGDSFPLEWFDAAAMREEATRKKYMGAKEEAEYPFSFGWDWGEEFRVFFTSEFSKEDYADFLSPDESFGLPLHKLAVFNVLTDDEFEEKCPAEAAALKAAEDAQKAEAEEKAKSAHLAAVTAGTATIEGAGTVTVTKEEKVTKKGKKVTTKVTAKKAAKKQGKKTSK